MNSKLSELIEKIQSANNILITVNKDPSVDQLASCIGLTLLINKIHKHGTAVFSGLIPSTLDFLQPEETIEKNTDSLRDFIIALDKNKADKLRYKQEDNHVKIYITPYRTSINESDLEFSKGDFNVELIIALGVISKEDLDHAITSHGRILHDATVAVISVSTASDLGTINYLNAESSSLSEVITELSFELGENLLDTQIATALLTGIVASTDRFSNSKTTSNALSVGAQLMAAGANQQLVVNKLAENQNNSSPQPSNLDSTQPPIDNNSDNPINNSTDLSISHENIDNQSTWSDDSQPDQSNNNFDLEDLERANEIGKMADINLPTIDSSDNTEPPAKFMTEPPAINNPLTANAMPEPLDPAIDPLSGHLPVSEDEINSMTLPSVVQNVNIDDQSPTETDPVDDKSNQEIDQPQDKIDQARNEVTEALLDSQDEHLPPIKALNAQPLVELSHVEPHENEISIDKTTGQVLTKSEMLKDINTESSVPHELRIEPLHDMKTENILEKVNASSIINNVSPPPVPPPIPIQFNTGS